MPEPTAPPPTEASMAWRREREGRIAAENELQRERARRREDHLVMDRLADALTLAVLLTDEIDMAGPCPLCGADVGRSPVEVHDEGCSIARLRRAARAARED